jgi:hypothetical protein
MNLSRTTLFVSMGLSAAVAVAAGCGNSSNGGSPGTGDDGGQDGTTGASGSGGSTSSGSSSGGSSSGGSSSGTSSGSSSGSSSGGSSSSSDAGPDTGPDAACVDLTVKNYKDWCTLSVNGQPLANSGPPGMGSSTVCVPPGTVDLVASPYDTTFTLGPAPWHGTSGDQDGGDPGVYVDAGTGDAEVKSTTSTTVTVTSDGACVWACCPFTNGSGCALTTTGNLCATSSTPDAGPDASPDAAPEAGVDSGVDAGCVELTVKNYLTWCTLSVNGTAIVPNNSPGSTSSTTVCVPPGTTDLVASPISTTFELGPDPWHDTSGDHGSGDPGTQADVDGGVHATSSTTVVTTTGSACVWACCPFTDGTGCTTTNQCP